MRPTVLIVDDEKDLAETFAEIFSMEGFDTLLAHDGLQALEVLKLQHVDLIVSDAKMPKMSGPDLAKKLKDMGKKRPFLLVTGFSDVDSSQLSNLGIDAMFSKPIDADELLDAAKEYISVG